MWYALGHIYQPPVTPPPAISRMVQPAKPALLPSAPVAVPTPTAPKVTKGAVFEMPANLPAFLRKVVTVPDSDKTSEFAALKYVAKQAGVPFSHTGPDYALMGTKVPFAHPVPAYEFLWYVGNSYIPGVLNANGNGAIVVGNSKPAG